MSSFELYLAIFGIGVGSEKFFWFYSYGLITFILNDFFLFSNFLILAFWDHVSLFGPHRCIFSVGMGSEKLFTHVDW